MLHGSMIPRFKEDQYLHYLAPLRVASSDTNKMLFFSHSKLNNCADKCLLLTAFHLDIPLLGRHPTACWDV